MRLRSWTHWHSKAVLVAAMGVNIANALVFELAVVPSWIMTGVCIGFLLADTLLWRLWKMNHALVKTIDDQNEFIQKLGQTKTDEIAERIAQNISNITGQEVEMIRVPNETFRKDKLH